MVENEKNDDALLAVEDGRMHLFNPAFVTLQEIRELANIIHLKCLTML